MPITQVELTESLVDASLGMLGVLLHWTTAALLLLFFVQLPRYGAHRGRLWTWTAAWAALVVGHFGEAIAAFGLLIRDPAFGSVTQQLFDSLHVPARLTFLALITMAALTASGRNISGPWQRQVTMFTIVVGMLIALVDQGSIARVLLLLGTPLMFFGSAPLLLAAARGERERGLTVLASGLVLFASVATVFQLAQFSRFAFVSEAARHLLTTTYGYGMSLATMMLGGAVVVLVVQDSVLQATQAREDHLRDVAASEARLKRIIEAAGEAIITFAGPDHRIDLANAASARLFGLPAGALVGRKLDDLIDLGDKDWDEVLAPVLQSGFGQVKLTTSGLRGADQVFPVEFTLGALGVMDRSTGGGVAILRDLSQRQADELERKQFERRIAESEKMLAIGRVVSGVAHELNNPLAVVLGQSEELVTGNVDEPTRAGLVMINEQAHRARHIVRDLLAFVRLPEDRGEVVELVPLVRRVIEGQSRAAMNHGVTVEVAAEAGGPRVRIDRPGLEQVIINLLDNAMDAAGSGGHVRVGVMASDGEARIVVEDDGPGVPDELLGRIFEPFFTTKPTGQGTGLGLAVSAGMLEQYGGVVRLENRPAPGIGARFIVAMPAVAADPTAPASPKPGTPTGSASPAVAAGTVLLIDDEPAVRATIEKIFQRWGWQVYQTDSGHRAIAMLTDDDAIAPDLILCDLKMPEMSGKEFHAVLKERGPDLVDKVIFVTGDVVESDTARFLASFDSVVVEKPFTMAEIARAVERVVKQD